MSDSSDKTSPKPLRVALLLVALTALALTVYGCSGARSGESTYEIFNTVEVTSESVPNAQDATSEETNAGDSGRGGVASGETGQPGGQGSSASGDAGVAISPDNRVSLRLDGDDGVRYSGFCRLNGERERLRGGVPESLEYRLKEDGAVECVIRKRGGDGRLKVTMESGGRRSIQQTDARNGEVRIGFSGDGSSISTGTSGTSTNTSFGLVVSQQSSSSVTVTNDSSSGED